MRTDSLKCIAVFLFIVSIGVSPGSLFAQTTNGPTEKPPSIIISPKPRVVRLSSGLDDIVKLTKAGIDESVILAFVQSSAVAYRPSAPEIVQLREMGVTSQVIAAMLRRGEDLRERAAAARRDTTTVAPQTPPPPPSQTPPPAPQNPPSTAVTTVPSVTYATVVYPAYRPSTYYGYGGWAYPRYSSYYSYPRYSYYHYPRASYYGGCYSGASFSLRVGGYGGYGGGYRYCR